MNIIHHKVYKLEFDVWEPFSRDVENEMDKLAALLKTKDLLQHTGRVRLQQTEDTIIFRGQVDESGIKPAND